MHNKKPLKLLVKLKDKRKNILFHKLPRRGVVFVVLVSVGVQIVGRHQLPGPLHFSIGEAKKLP